MWKELSEREELNQIKEQSREKPILIFKHSTRCSLSSMAKNRLERNWDDSGTLEPYILDLVRYREVSQAIASEFRIPHESPQVLLISGGECIYDASHMSIDYHEIVARVAS